MDLMNQSPKQKQRKNMKPARVSYFEGGEKKTGILTGISKSTVSPEFDVAYVDFGHYWKVALLSELI